MAKTINQTTKHIPFILLAASLLIAATMAVKVLAYTTYSKTIPAKIANAVDAANSKDKDTKTYSANYTDIAGELKKQSVFAPPPPGKKNPVKTVDGILGNCALIGGKFYKAGDKIGDAELISIEPTHIVIKFDGKEIRLAPLAKPTKHKASEKKTEKSKDAQKPAQKTATPLQQETPVAEQVETTAEDDPFAWMGVKLSPALRAKLLGQWNTLTDEQKEEAKKQWNDMSQEKKEQAIEQMEKHL